jgi:lysophospholipase L1-like esterase
MRPTRPALTKGLVYVIGDSHVCALSGRNVIHDSFPIDLGDGIPWIRSIRLGAVLAYNLVSLDTRNQGRQRLFTVLRILPPGANVLLCFGEIDCRAHLLKQAEKQARPLVAIVRECVRRYARVIREVQSLDFRVGVLAPFASSWDRVDPSIDFPYVGTCQERNAVTRLFTSSLTEQCAKLTVPVISILDDLVDKNGQSNRKYFLDGCHLSTRALPLLLPRIRTAFKLAASRTPDRTNAQRGSARRAPNRR